MKVAGAANLGYFFSYSSSIEIRKRIIKAGKALGYSEKLRRNFSLPYKTLKYKTPEQVEQKFLDAARV